MTILPNAIGRIDAITEAIRDGDRERAIELVREKNNRLRENLKFVEKELTRLWQSIHETGSVLYTLQYADVAAKHKYDDLRKACGWSGVDGFDGPVETLPPVKPKLRAENLEVGTVMVLGGENFFYWGYQDTPGFDFERNSDGNEGSKVFQFTYDELQELIDRGVRFELPKEGEK